jgi:hypothetical protein
MQPPLVAGAPMSVGYVLVVIPSSRTNNLEGCAGRLDTTNFRTSDLSLFRLSSVSLDEFGERFALSGMRGKSPVTSTNCSPGLHITRR